MKKIVAAVVFLFVLAIPVSLFAQDGEDLTLAGLNHAIKAMESDFTIFALELRRRRRPSCVCYPPDI